MRCSFETGPCRCQDPAPSPGDFRLSLGEKRERDPIGAALVCVEKELCIPNPPGAERLPEILVELCARLNTSRSSRRQERAQHPASVKPSEAWPCDCFQNHGKEEIPSASSFDVKVIVFLLF